jgi:broad specificity phosphatase PhoE
MRIVFIRHGEPDYIPCDKRGFIGHGRDLATLSENGIEQAEQVSKDAILQNSEIILSSPYTRALQTAAIISRNINRRIIVETDLHEWLPDKTFQYKTSAQSFALYHDFQNNKGSCSEGKPQKWESIDEIINRVIPTLEKYLSYKKIIVVSHGEVIRRFIGISKIEYCKPYEIDFEKNYKCYRIDDLLNRMKAENLIE